MAQHYDLIIVGAGMVGATLAKALADTPLRIALLDAAALNQPLAAQSTVSGYDPRVSALSAASERIFTHLGVWPLIDAKARCAYRHMHVWDAEGTGEIHFDAHSLNENRLGHIIENHRVQQALLDALGGTRIDLLGGQRVEALVREDEGWRLGLDNGERLYAPLIVAADGGRSRLRELAGFAMREWDYLHSAIVTTVQVSQPHQDTAWQRFLPSGPLAFLPLPDVDGRHYCSVVWSLLPDQAQRVMARPGMTAERLAATLARQMSDAEKRRRADFVVPTGLGRRLTLNRLREIVTLLRARRGTKWPNAVLGPRKPAGKA